MACAFIACTCLWLWSISRANWKKEVLQLSAWRRQKGESQAHVQVFNQRHQRGETRNKASCFNLLKWIPQVKSVNSEVRSVSSLPTGFPQMGPWHHVGATMEITLDKNWSFIGSGGNWIPCMQNQTRPRTKESLMKYPSEIPCRKMRKVERRPDRRMSIQSSAFWNCLMSSNWGPNNRKNSRQIAKTVQSSKISKGIPIRFSA